MNAVLRSSSQDVGPWRVTLHPPVRIYQGTREEHITRPNLCVLDGAAAAIFQTTFDTSATPRDNRDIWVTTDGGCMWRLAARGVDIGSYCLYSKSDGEAVVLPYDSIRYGTDRSSLAGPRTALSWQSGALRISSDTTVAHFPKPLMGFLAEPIKDDNGKPLYLADDLPPNDKPITSFWGTIQTLPDGRWVAPAYGCYESDPRAVSSAAPEMRRMARFTSELLVSEDEGRHWSWFSRIATPGDVPEECLEGPTEVQLYQFQDRWRAVFRTSALKNHFQPLHYADSFDAGKTWSAPRVLPGVDMIMDPRGLILPNGITVLTAGRPKIGMFLAQGASLDFHKVDLNAHHNAYLPRLRTTGHTDVAQIGPHSLLVVYDYIPDSWRWPGSTFTSPDAIYAVRVDIEQTQQGMTNGPVRPEPRIHKRRTKQH